MRIEGRFFDAKRSLSRPATLSETAEGLRLDIEGEAEARRPRLKRLSERLGALPRKLEFEDGSLFEAPADAPVDGLQPGRGRLLATVARLEASWKIAAAAAVLTVLLLIGLYRYGVPLAARIAAGITPQAVSDLMNEGSLKAIDGILLEPSTLPDQRRADVTRLFGSLASQDPTSHFELIFRDGGVIGPNALALPGGTIIVTDQLIALARSEDEIAGVLAHEMGHVEQRHSLQQIYRALGLTALVALIGGDSSQLVHDAVNQAAALQAFAYSREFEAAADARSVDIMLAAHRDPLAFVNLLDRITASRTEDDGAGVLSTHPGNRDRRTAVEAQLRALGRK